MSVSAQEEVVLARTLVLRNSCSPQGQLEVPSTQRDLVVVIWRGQMQLAHRAQVWERLEEEPLVQQHDEETLLEIEAVISLSLGLGEGMIVQMPTEK